MPTVDPIKHGYKCLVCREHFKSHIPPEDAIYMWNVFQYRPRTGHTVLRCPHCYSMYYIPTKLEHNERLIDTFKLYRYLDKHILDEDKGYDKDLYDQMIHWFTGLKRCSTCKKLKQRETDFNYEHRAKDHLSYICKSCRNKNKNAEKIDSILNKYDELKGGDKHE
jgi:hypothetical protein